MGQTFGLSQLSFAVTVALSAPVFANDDNVDHHVVWGTKVSSNSEFLGDQDISLKQADHMSDLLRDIPGVDVGGTHSVNQRINIRSLNETDLDIRLDGASQHANMFHHIGNLTLNPDILKSADVVVGNNSVTQTGLGGSVYFETKDAKDLLRYNETFGARIFGSYATNASRQGSFTAYGLLTDQIDAMVYGHLVSRDNFEDGDGVETYGSAGDVGNILVKLGYEPSYEHRFEVSYDMYRDSGDYSPRPDMAGSANSTLTGDSLIPTDYDRDTLTASYQLNGEIHSGKVTIYSSKTELVRDESVMTTWPSNRQSENSASNQNIGANATFHYTAPIRGFDNRITYGVDVISQNTDSYYGGVKFMDEDTLSSALFVENTVNVTDALSITAGVRFDDFQRHAETSDSSYNDVTWALGADYDVTQQVTIFANTRSLFKGPELLESFVAYQDVTYLDDDIKAETGQNSEIGIKFAQRYDQHFVSANATVFKTDINDYIYSLYENGGYLMYNGGDVEIKGFEASFAYGYGALMAKLSYSHSDSNNVTTGEPLINMWDISADVGDSISLTLDYQVDAIETLLGWSSNVVLEEDNVVDGDDPKAAYDVHNLYAQWTPSSIEGLQVTFGIDNVFNELYISHASRSGVARGATLDDYEPGRNFKLSAAYQF
jgi:hemoglobin/transferrin/lactoferrin receptor protein